VAGFRNGARIVGMVLQQSCPWCPWDEQGIEPQQCIACSGVAMGAQSKAYAASSSATTANKKAFANRIKTKLVVSRDCVKASVSFAAQEAALRKNLKRDSSLLRSSE
jgi:hypothetical protein